MPGPYRDCTGSPIPSEWHINTCHYKTVSFVSQHSLKSMRFQEAGSYSRWAGQGLRRSLTHQQDWYQLLCGRRSRRSAARTLQNDLQQMTKQSESPINLTPLDACLWTVGGSCSTWRESTQKEGEHANYRSKAGLFRHTPEPVLGKRFWWRKL